MKETAKYYPCGAMRPEYVEAMIDNLILPDKERLIEKLATANGYRLDFEMEFPDAYECVEKNNVRDLLEAMDNDDIKEFIADQLTVGDWLEDIDITDAIEYYGVNDILENIPEDIIRKHLGID